MPTTFNTTDPKPGYVYDSATDTWFPLLGIAPGSSVVRWRKTAAGAETSVSGLDDLGATLSYNAGTEQVYLNGVLLVRTEDYLATTGTSITGLTALAASDVIEVIAFNATNVQITDALLETDINAKGDLIVGAAVDTAAILASGTNGQVLSVNTATATGLEWVTSDDANAIQSAIVDAKGDIIAATAADTVARLAVGTNGQVLTAASGQATGLQWTTPSAGGMTLISQYVASGDSAIDFTSISGDYKQLLLMWAGVKHSTSGSAFGIRFNADSNSNYNCAGMYASNSVFTGQTDTKTSIFLGGNDYFPFGADAQSSTIHKAPSGYLLIDNYSSTTKAKTYSGQWSYYDESNSYVRTVPSLTGYYNSTTAITQLNIFRGLGSATLTNNADTTIRLYGVS